MTFEEAGIYLADAVQPDGNLYQLGWYLQYDAGLDTATLDGEFSADDLEAIAAYMRGSLKAQSMEEPMRIRKRDNSERHAAFYDGELIGEPDGNGKVILAQRQSGFRRSPVNGMAA